MKYKEILHFFDSIFGRSIKEAHEFEVFRTSYRRFEYNHVVRIVKGLELIGLLEKRYDWYKTSPVGVNLMENGIVYDELKQVLLLFAIEDGVSLSEFTYLGYDKDRKQEIIYALLDLEFIDLFGSPPKFALYVLSDIGCDILKNGGRS